MKQNKKLLAIVVSVILVIGLAVGVTSAFLTDNSEQIENVFDPSRVTTRVDETIDGDEKTEVKIANTGDTEAFIRATYVVTWQDEAGNVWGQAPVAGIDYEIEFGTGWLQNEADGFYYWPTPVAKDDATGILIKRIKPLQGAPEENYYLNVEILGSGIQSVPASAVEAWSNDQYTVTGVGTADAVLKAK